MIHYENMTKEQVISILKDTEEYIGEVHKDYDIQKEEIERLNNIIDKKEKFLGDNIKRLEREVVKRDNIINELEKDLKEKIDEDRLNILSNSHWKYVLDKLQELKDSDKE